MTWTQTKVRSLDCADQNTVASMLQWSDTSRLFRTYVDASDPVAIGNKDDPQNLWRKRLRSVTVLFVCALLDYERNKVPGQSKAQFMSKYQYGKWDKYTCDLIVPPYVRRASVHSHAGDFLNDGVLAEFPEPE